MCVHLWRGVGAIETQDSCSRKNHPADRNWPALYIATDSGAVNEAQSPCFFTPMFVRTNAG